MGTISHVMEALTEKYQPIKNLKLCVFQDGTLIFEDVELRAQPLCPKLQREADMLAQTDEDISMLEVIKESIKEERTKSWAHQYRVNKQESMRIHESFSVKRPVLLETDSQSQVGEEKQQSDESPTELKLGANLQQYEVKAGRQRGIEETIKIGNAEEGNMVFEENQWQK